MSDGRDDDSSRECAGTRRAGACRNARRSGVATGVKKALFFGRFGGALGALSVGFSDPRFAQAPAGPGVVENAVPAQLFSLGEPARPRAGWTVGTVEEFQSTPGPGTGRLSFNHSGAKRTQTKPSPREQKPSPRAATAVLPLASTFASDETNPTRPASARNERSETRCVSRLGLTYR